MNNNVSEDIHQAIEMCKEIEADKGTDSWTRWAMAKKTFSKISQCYQFTNENMDAYYKRFDLNAKKVLTVCGSGDQVIYAIIKGAKVIDVFDTNKLTYYNLFLKLSALIGLDYNEFIDFENLNQKNNHNIKYYKKIRDLITNDDVKLFWDSFFKEPSSLFPYFFLSNYNSINWNEYLEKLQSRISYLNEEHFYNTKNKLQNSKSKIDFKLVDFINLSKCFNKQYDFINCSNIISYINLHNIGFDFLDKLITNNLDKDGSILLNYHWSFLGINIELWNKYYNSKIITLNYNNTNDYESVLVYKR